MKSNTYVHCSWDQIDPNSFFPRIPSNRCSGEDISTPRICVSETIQRALLAMPRADKTLEGIRKFGIPAIIHVYYLSINDEKYIYHPTTDQLPDVEMTGEVWLLKKPDKVVRRDYLISDELLVPVVDEGGIEFRVELGCNIKRIKKQSNMENLAKKLGVRVDELRSIASFRTLMSNWKQILKIAKK